MSDVDASVGSSINCAGDVVGDFSNLAPVGSASAAGLELAVELASNEVLDILTLVVLDGAAKKGGISLLKLRLGCWGAHL